MRSRHLLRGDRPRTPSSHGFSASVGVTVGVAPGVWGHRGESPWPGAQAEDSPHGGSVSEDGRKGMFVCPVGATEHQPQTTKK